MFEEDPSPLAAHQATLRAEAAALTLLAEYPPPGLADAHDLLLAATSRGLILFSGVGKSGFVARRAASTFTSVGIPSAYLDPLGAFHGDLGLLAPAWAIVLISKSGNTEEMVRLALAALPTPVLAITEGGQLETLSSVTIRLPQLGEAAGNLPAAPTVSVALQSAITDALAMGLASALPNSERLFRCSHPGGSIGRLPLN